MPQASDLDEGQAGTVRAALAGHPSLLDTLACAYAESGDFDKAIETETEALKLVTNEKQKQHVAEMIEAFKKKMTYIQLQEAKKEKYPGGGATSARPP